MWKVRIPSKICVDNSVDNSESFPHFPYANVEKWDIHSLSTGFPQLPVDNKCRLSVRTERMWLTQTHISKT